MQRFVNVTEKVCERQGTKTCECQGKSLWRQMFVNAMAKVVCECHGKSLWKPHQKFVNSKAKVCERYGKEVCERHGKSLWKPRQKFVNATAKVCEPHGKSLWKPQQNFECHRKSLWTPRQKFEQATTEVDIRSGRNSHASFLARINHVMCILPPFALLVQ